MQNAQHLGSTYPVNVTEMSCMLRMVHLLPTQALLQELSQDCIRGRNTYVDGLKCMLYLAL